MKFRELYEILTNIEKYKAAVELLSGNAEYSDVVRGDLAALNNLHERLFLRLKDEVVNIPRAYGDKLNNDIIKLQNEVNSILGSGKDQYQLLADTDYVEKSDQLAKTKEKKENLIINAGTEHTNWDLVRQFNNDVPNPENGNAGIQFLAKGLLVPGNQGNVIGTLDEYKKLNIKAVLDFYENTFGEEYLDKVFSGIDINISFATEEYIKNGKLGNEVIKGYMPLVNEIPQPVGGVSFEKASAIRKGAEADAKALKYMLGGLTAENGPAYERRLQSIAKASVTVNETDRIFAFAGIDFGTYKNLNFGVQYIKELILKTDTFKASREDYTRGIDFEKVKEDAEKRFSGELISSKDAKAAANSWRQEGKNLESDKEIIDIAFANCNSAADFNKAFDKLVLDIVDGNTGLTKYENDKLVRRPKDIAKAATYVCSMYELDRQDRHLNDFGITPDAVNAKCSSLAEPEVTAKSYLEEFNIKLNLYRVDGAELRALNFHTPVQNPTSPADINMNKNYLRAHVKTEGISCNGDSPILNDAIFTYSQLKDAHAGRKWHFKWLHPIKNYRENRAIEQMEDTLRFKYALFGNELEARINEIKNSGEYFTAGKLAELKVSDKKAYKEAMNLNRARKAERDNIINTQLENIEKYGSRVKPQSEIEKEHDVIKPSGNKLFPTFLMDKDIVIDNNVPVKNMSELISQIKGSTEMIAEINFSKKENELVPDKSLSDQDVMRYIKSDKGLNEKYMSLLEKQSEALNKNDATKDELDKAQNVFEKGINDLDTEVRKRYTLQKQVLKENTADIELFIDKEGYEKDHESETTELKEELDEMIALDKAKHPDMFLSKEDKNNPEKVNEAKEKAPSPEEIRKLEDAHEYNQKIRDYNKECREYNKQSRINQFWDKFDEFKKDNPEADTDFLTDIEPDKKERDMTLARMQINVDAHKKQVQEIVDAKEKAEIKNEPKDIEKKQEDLNKQLNMEVGNNISNINNNVQPKRESKQVIIEDKKIEEPNIGELKK